MFGGFIMVKYQYVDDTKSTKSKQSTVKSKTSKTKTDIIIPVKRKEQQIDFGIRFWGFIGKNLNIKNYSKMNLDSLKKSIATNLLEQTKEK